MGKGFLSPHTSGTVYVQEFSPWRDPALLKSAVAIFFYGIITGVILVAVLLNAKEDDKTAPKPTPTVTVVKTHTVYKAPVGHE